MLYQWETIKELEKEDVWQDLHFRRVSLAPGQKLKGHEACHELGCWQEMSQGGEGRETAEKETQPTTEDTILGP